MNIALALFQARFVQARAPSLVPRLALLLVSFLTPLLLERGWQGLMSQTLQLFRQVILLSSSSRFDSFGSRGLTFQTGHDSQPTRITVTSAGFAQQNRLAAQASLSETYAAIHRAQASPLCSHTIDGLLDPRLL